MNPFRFSAVEPWLLPNDPELTFDRQQLNQSAKDHIKIKYQRAAPDAFHLLSRFPLPSITLFHLQLEHNVHEECQYQYPFRPVIQASNSSGVGSLFPHGVCRLNRDVVLIDQSQISKRLLHLPLLPHHVPRISTKVPLVASCACYHCDLGLESL